MIAKTYTPTWTLTVGGIDVTTDLLDVDINRLVTEGTGNFSLNMVNANNEYKFAGMEAIEIKADFSAGTTTFFKGTVEEVKKQYADYTKIRLLGRHISGELADLSVTEVYENQEMSAIFKDIFNVYAPSYATDFQYVNSTSPAITDSISFDQTPFYEALREIAYRANFDYYIDDDKKPHFFNAGSILNNAEIVSPFNFISSDGLGDSLVEIKNRIITYGTSSSGVPIIWTVNDAASQTAYGVREKFISDSRITSLDIAKMMGNAFLTFNKDKNKIGTVNCFALPTLKPGDKIWILNPTVGISGQFRVSHINDKIGNNGWYTNVTVERMGSVRFSNLLKDIMKSGSTVDFKNPNKMRYSLVEEFDSMSGLSNYSGVTIENSEVRQTSLGSTGSITSIITTAPISNVSYVELRTTGQDLKGSTVKFSNNGKLNYITLTENQLASLSTTGNQLAYQITLQDNSTNLLPIIKGLSFLYRG